jgi:hypothetical protein
MMNTVPPKPSIPAGSSQDAPGAPITERLTPEGLRPICSEEVTALTSPRDNCGQGGFSDAGQQQVLIMEIPPHEEKANP